MGRPILGLDFDGTWPAIETLKAFRPWNKRPAP